MPRYWPIILAALAGAAVLYAGLQTGANELESWNLAARWTARVGFPFLILAYIASSLVRLWPMALTRALLRERKWIGLAFATTHTFHLYALANVLLTLPEFPGVAGLVPGGLAYLLLYGMALTSFPWAYKALGKNWKCLHMAGIHVLWFSFAFAYAAKALFQPDQRVAGVVLGTIALGALAIRIAAWLKGRTARRQLTPA